MRVIDEALDEWEQVDVALLSDDELHELVVRHFDLESRLAAMRAACVGEWDARRVWDSDGSKAGWARLERECARSETTAKTEIRRARRLRSMPVTARAFGEGKVSVDQVEVLIGACDPVIATVFAR